MRPRVIADSFSLWLKLGLRAPGVLVFVVCALPLIAITTLMRGPSMAGNMDSGLVVPLVAIAVLPHFLGLALRPADPFVHLLPISSGERQVATAAVLQAFPLALGALLCLVVRTDERALVTAAVLTAAGSGAFAARLGLTLPFGFLLFFVAPVLAGIAVNRLSAPALLVVGVATTIGNLVLPERIQQAEIVHPRRLVDRPRRRRRCGLLRLFLRADGSAWGPAGMLLLFPVFFFWDPRTPSPFFGFMWVAALAGIAVGRFMSGSAGQMLFVLPVRRRRLMLTLGGYLLASVMLMPLAIIATTHAASDRLAPRIASCTPRNGNRRCEETVENRMADVLEVSFRQLPRPATVRLVDDLGRVEIVPSSAAMAAWRTKVLREALRYFLASIMVAGATILIYVLVARRRRMPAVP